MSFEDKLCQIENGGPTDELLLRSRPIRTWRTYVTVVGRVARVRTDGAGGWRLRLADTGGALAAAEIRPSHPLPLPPVGARIIVCGSLCYDEEHCWYVVDPVEQWLESDCA